MYVVAPVIGSLVVVAGLLDVFLTVLHYDSPGLYTATAYRGIWRVLHGIARRLPRSAGRLVLSVAAPGMVVMTLAAWLGAQVLGFALVFYPGIAGHSFAVGHGASPFAVALYFSAATLTSLSFSDVEPRSLPYHGLAALETLIGLGILTLTISYVLGLYGLLQEQGELATRLHHRTEVPGDPRSLLVPHFRDGHAVGVSDLLRELHQTLTAQAEGMRRYPVVYYFHASEPYRSLPYLFWFIGATAAALRWGLPEGHPVAADPWLPGLLTGYADVSRSVGARMVTAGARTPDPPPVDPARFAAAAASPPAEHDTAYRADDAHDPVSLLNDFLVLEQFMGGLAHLLALPPTDQRYDRYVAWSRFAARGRAFVAAASRDLGLDPASLAEHPERHRR